MLELKNRKVTVVGMGRSGAAAAKLCLKHGAVVLATDVKPASELGNSIAELESAGAAVETGGHGEQSFRNADLIVLSPGVRTDLAAVKTALSLGIPVIGELELAFQSCRSPFIAITGTKGKTTTVTLTEEILRHAGKKAVVAGNIGFALSNIAESAEPDCIIVAEVSSFQLETVTTFKPRLAGVLNVSADHLDRYKNVQQYAEAKSRIFRNQDRNDFALLNADDKYTPIFTRIAKAKQIYFGINRNFEEGVWRSGNTITGCINGLEKPIADAGVLKIPGEHNLCNAMAACAAGLAFGVEPEKISGALAGFKGVPHRQEPVAEINGVLYVNNSQGTNVDAVAKSLLSYEPPIILIAGGRSKGGNFSDLSELMKSRVKLAILIGEAKQELMRVFNGSVEIKFAESMEDAVSLASRSARPGDTVLLSPGCASFDMFKNYEDRGEKFRSAVMSLKGQKCT